MKSDRLRIEINPGYSHLRSFVETLPQRFDSEGEPVFRHRNEVRSFGWNGEKVAVKSFHRPSFFNRIVYTFFRSSKAKRAYRYSFMLNERGIGSPMGIACVETRRHGLIDASFFVSPYSGLKPVFPEIVTATEFDVSLARAVGRFFATMHVAGVLHGDPNLKNILYGKTSDGDFRFEVIDTNRSRFREKCTRRECVENLKRVTHRRDALRMIVSEYAMARGMDADSLVKDVSAALDRFERQKERRRRLKKLF